MYDYEDKREENLEEKVPALLSYFFMIVGLLTALSLLNAQYTIKNLTDRLDGSSFASVLPSSQVSVPSDLKAVTTVHDKEVYMYKFIGLAEGSNKLPIISYSRLYREDDGFKSDFRLASCKDANCKESKITILDSFEYGLTGMFSAVTVGKDGFPVIAFVSRIGSYGFQPGSGLKIIKCNDAACEKRVATVIEPNFYSTGWASIALGSDGLPIFAYSTATGGYPNAYEAFLTVVKCTNPECSTFRSTRILDPDGYNGMISGNAFDHPALIIGADGYPIISYANWNQERRGILKVAKCTNLSCTTYRTSAISSEQGGILGESIIALNKDGNPLIAHRIFKEISPEKLGYNKIVVIYGIDYCEDPFCKSTTFKEIHRTAELPWWIDSNESPLISFAVGKDNLPVLAITNIDIRESDYASIRLFKCSDEACNTTTATTIANEVGHHTMIVGENNFPFIVYTPYLDGQTGFLVTTKCKSTTCK